MSQKNKFAISMISHGGIGVTNERGETVRNLTGSCHELTIQYNSQLLRILVDVGGYQGTGSLERDIKKIAKGVKAIVLTHPHMDHIGEFATLYNAPEVEQYSGKVIASQGTKKAADSALRDAAKIMQQKYDEEKKGKTGGLIKKIEESLHIVENYKNRNQGVSPIKKGRSGRMEETSEPTVNTRYTVAQKFLEPYKKLLTYENWKKILLPEPAFTLEDVTRAVNQIETHTISKGWKEIIPGKVAIRLYNAGHIIGSTSVLFKIIDTERKPHHILFTGDIGSYKWDLHINGLPEPPNNLAIDAVVIESTYGGKVREPFEKGREEFETSLINAFNDIPDTAEQKGRKSYNQVILSCFSLDRLQNILFRVVALKKAGKINVPIYVDSPLGLQYIDAYLQEAKQTLKHLKEPKQANILSAVGENYLEREKKLLEEFIECLSPHEYQFISVNDADTRNRLMQDSDEKRIIITASGMANGGPVMSYLASFASDSGSAFYFPGYLAEGTLGCQLAGAAQTKRVKINGAMTVIQARMKNFTFLSGHGDEEDLLMYLEGLKFRKDTKIIIVHGDKDKSSTSLSHTISRQLGITQEQIYVPDILEEIRIQGNGISRTKHAEKGPSRLQLLIEELEETLHIQNLLLLEKTEEATSTANKEKGDGQKSYTLKDTDSQNIDWEIHGIQEDILKLTGIISRLQSFKSIEEVSLSFMKTINESYRYNTTAVTPKNEEDSVTSLPTISQAQLKSLQKKPVKEVLPEVKEEVPEDSQAFPLIKKLNARIKEYNEDNTTLMEEIYVEVDRDGIADLKKAMKYIGELKGFHESLTADQSTLSTMKKAQERRSTDGVPTVINGEPIDKRKVERLSRLKGDKTVYENASRVAIESLEERMGITRREIERINNLLHHSVGAFGSAEEISVFLITGKLPAKRNVGNTSELRQAKKQGKIERLQELAGELKEREIEIQTMIETDLATLAKLDQEREEQDSILKHIPEYIESLLSGVRKRLSRFREELSELHQLHETIQETEEEIGAIESNLTKEGILLEQLGVMGIIHIPKTRNMEQATHEVYIKRREDTEMSISKAKKEIHDLRHQLDSINLSLGKITKEPEKKRKEYLAKQEEKKQGLEKKIEDSTIGLLSLQEELERINTILENTPEYLRLELKRLGKSRGQLLEQKRKIENSGLTPSIVSQMNEEMKQSESMLQLLSGKLANRAELIAVLKKSGIVYLSEDERKKMPAVKNQNPRGDEIFSTYAIYINKRKKTEKELSQTGRKIAALRKEQEQLREDIETIQIQVHQLQEAPFQGKEQSTEDMNESSFWLPQVSQTEINQGIYLAIVGILEKMGEYREFKRNLIKIRGSDTSDTTMTESEFIEKESEIKKLHEANKKLRPIIKGKLIEHFSAREVASQNDL